MQEAEPTNSIPVSIVIPAKNEEGFISSAVESLLSQSHPPQEILVVDGMSSDGTVSVVQSLAQNHPQVAIVRNEKEITPAAFNRGIERATGEILFFLSAHGEYPRSFIEESVKLLISHPEAWCAGGLMQSVGKSFKGKVIAAAASSPFGVGSSRHKTGNYRGYVDTISFGAYWRWVFDEVGPFDEELIRNQDADMNYRILKAGGKLYMDSSIESRYYTRDTFSQLWKQYIQYGFWRAQTTLKHGAPTSLRQVVPLLFAAALVLLPPLTLLHRLFFYLLVLFVSAYALFVLAGAISIGRGRGYRYILASIPVFPVLHIAWGFGGLLGYWCRLVRRGNCRFLKKMTSLSR